MKKLALFVICSSPVPYHLNNDIQVKLDLCSLDSVLLHVFKQWRQRVAAIVIASIIVLLSIALATCLKIVFTAKTANTEPGRLKTFQFNYILIILYYSI